MTYQIFDDMLYKNGVQVPYVPTPNRGGVIKPEALCMHHTASGITPGGDIAWLTDRRASASTHLITDVNGNHTQLAPFNIKTWHAGQSKWWGRRNCNNFMIGFEVDNPGHLTKLANGMYDGVGGPYRPEDVVEMRSPQHGNHRYWLRFPDAQIRETIAAGVAVYRHYQLKEIVAHYDVSPGRKTDIAPNFPIDKMRSLAAGRNDAEPVVHPKTGVEVDGYVRAPSGLNVRRWPWSPTKVGKLTNGSGVDIVRSGSYLDKTGSGGEAQWHLVTSGKLQGWCHADFIELV